MKREAGARLVTLVTLDRGEMAPRLSEVRRWVRGPPPGTSFHSTLIIASSSNFVASSLHVAACDAVTWPMVMQHFA